ncbi:MAG: transglutaminase-like cysteine peptidase [Xanthobacteraceae bacterium]|nr:transglutaminase-like cysteine peptidase [Xanthobacteraceae bacterium]
MVLREPGFWQVRQYRIAAFAACASFAFGLAIMGTALALRAPQNAPLSEKLELPVAPQPQLELAVLPANAVSRGRNDAAAAAVLPSAMFAAKQAALWPQVVPERPRGALRANPDSFREIFGTASAEIGNAKILQRWTKILAEAADLSLLGNCSAGQLCEQPILARLRGELGRLRAMEKTEMVAAVNTMVNRSFRYAPDSAVYGVPDHWATLEEMLRNGAGDCEDFAIAKMWLLAAAGVPRANMRLVVLRDIIGRVDHAVLVISFGERNYVLDNRQAVLRADSEMKHYRPFYSLSADGKAWVHAIPVATQQAAVPATERR